jgi:hypothetical protein
MGGHRHQYEAPNSTSQAPAFVKSTPAGRPEKHQNSIIKKRSTKMAPREATLIRAMFPVV